MDAEAAAGGGTDLGETLAFVETTAYGVIFYVTQTLKIQ